jgi:hypothetical protein
MAKNTMNRGRPGEHLILINITPKFHLSTDNGLDWTHSYHLTCKYATHILVYEPYLG